MRKNKQSRRIKCINNGEVYASQKAAARALNLNDGSISKVVRGLIKHTKGYKFELTDEEVTYTED